MRNLLKLEQGGLIFLFSYVYFTMFPGEWKFYLALFFVPDLSFAAYALSKKTGAIVYNILHHQGFLAVLAFGGYYYSNEWILKLALVFLSHSTFDRFMGYGLKYYDAFEHTHLGWIGKQKALNEEPAS
ncbi:MULTISPECIES: DUF4260 domain-containing protein [unclassified Paraflavitalea]|uniref:DUF4260 domain-containing protein n=1 Tax=unclassified Paraflavitalea TaxID=2798305 RepID=UPI003D33EE41